MGTEQEFATRIEARNGVMSIALRGELDMATAPILDDQLLASHRDGATAILLDLRDVTFIDSSGLHSLVRAYRRAEQDGHRLLLVGATPTTRRLCQITGTEFLLDGEGTAELVGRFTGGGSQIGDQDGKPGAELHV